MWHVSGSPIAVHFAVSDKILAVLSGLPLDVATGDPAMTTKIWLATFAWFP